MLTGIGHTDIGRVRVMPSTIGVPIALFKAGYRDLIPVPRGQKGPTMKGWQNHQATAVEVKDWTSKGVNVGMLAKNFGCIDIDVMDSQLVSKIVPIAWDIIGPTPRRIGQPPKCLMPYRTDFPMKKQTFAATKDGVTHSIEFLGDGQQYIVHGMHPNGKPYRWADGNLFEIKPDNLPGLTIERLAEFYQALRDKVFVGWDIKCALIQTETTPADVPSAEDSAPVFTTVNMWQVHRAVNGIPNTPESDRDLWQRMAHYIKGSVEPEDDQEALGIFLKWSAQWPESSEDNDLKLWNSIDRGDMRSGWKQLRGLAIDAGKFEDASTDFQTTADTPKLNIVTELEQVTVENVLARLLGDHTGPKLRYALSSNNEGMWYGYDGTVWRDRYTKHPDRIVREFCEMVSADVQLMQDIEAQVVDGAAKKSSVYQQVIKSLNTHRKVKDLLDNLSTRVEMHIDLDEFDDPVQTAHLLNTPAKTYDLKTCQPISRNPLHYLTQITAVSPDFVADCPVFKKFLTTSLSEYSNTAEMLDYLQRVMGYMLSGDTSQRKLFFVTGPSGSGKTTLMNVLQDVLGLGPGRYVSIIKADELVKEKGRKGEAHPTWLAKLQHTRIALGSEVSRGSRDEWNTGVLKNLSGNEAVSARGMRENFRDFRFVGKILISANRLPSFTEMDSAVRTRLRIINFEAPEQPDPDLPTKLRAEYPAILAWMMQGYQAMLERPFIDGNEPERVTESVSDYIGEYDYLEQFVAERCEVVAGNMVPTKVLYSEYEDFLRKHPGCTDVKEILGSQNAFTAGLREIKNEDGSPKFHRRRKVRANQCTLPDDVDFPDSLGNQFSAFEGISICTDLTRLAQQREIDSLIGEL